MQSCRRRSNLVTGANMARLRTLYKQNLARARRIHVRTINRQNRATRSWQAAVNYRLGALLELHPMFLGDFVQLFPS
jgi:hypothetical protein